MMTIINQWERMGEKEGVGVLNSPFTPLAIKKETGSHPHKHVPHNGETYLIYSVSV